MRCRRRLRRSKTQVVRKAVACQRGKRCKIVKKARVAVKSRSRAVRSAKNGSGLADQVQTEGEGLLAGEGVIDDDGLPHVAEFVEDTALVGNIRIDTPQGSFQALAAIVNDKR